jgi:hypothetical protein
MKLYTKALTILFLSSFFTATFAKEVMIMDEDFRDDEGVFHFGATVNYLIQSNNIPQIQVANRLLSVPTLLPDYPLGHNDPDTMPGWGVELGYLFPNHEDEILIRYQQIKTDQSEDLSYTGNLQRGTSVITTSSLHQSYDFDYFDGEILGRHYFNIEEEFVWNIGYGIKYLNIAQRTSGDYNIFIPNIPPFPDVGFNVPSTAHNNFHGVGPMLTGGISWEWSDIYSLVSDIGIAALAGKADAAVDSLSITENASFFPTTQVALLDKKDDKVVFGLEGDIGINYQLALSDDVNANVELGFEVYYYPNAFIEISEVVRALNTINTLVEITADDDYVNYGPYLTLSMDF